MSMALAPARAADSDGEIALITYDKISDMVEIGDEVEVVDPVNLGTWVGTVIEVDDDMRAFFVKVEPDTFTPRDQLTPLQAFEDLNELDLYENKSSGKIFTLEELLRLGNARRMMND